MYLAIFDWTLLFDLSVIIQLKYLFHLKQKIYIQGKFDRAFNINEKYILFIQQKSDNRCHNSPV